VRVSWRMYVFLQKSLCLLTTLLPIYSFTQTGNVLYYGDVFGRIIALEVADYETASPTSTPSDVPSLTPSVIPSASSVPSLAPSESPSLAPTVVASEAPSAVPSETTTHSPTVSGMPSSLPTGPTPPVAPIFDEFDELSGLGGGQPEEDEDSDILPLIIGSAFAGVFAVGIAVFAISKTKSKKRREEERQDIGVLIVDDAPNDLESGSETKATTNDTVEMEVVGGSPVFSPKSMKPKKKSKKKKKKRSLRNQSPATPQTLECIEESPDDFSQSDSVALIDEDDDGSAAKDLNNQFQYVAEIGNDSQHGDSDAESLEFGTAGKAANGSHIELAVGNNRLKPLLSQDDSDEASWAMSVDSKDAGIKEPKATKSPNKGTASGRGVPPRSVDVRKKEEEKKDDSSNPAQFSPLRKEPAANQSEANMSPMTPTSEKSSESSVFLEDSDSFDSTGGKAQTQGQELSPLSPHILSKSLDESAPEDEAMGVNGARLIAPSLSHKYNSRGKQEDMPDDEVSAPGSHYMSSKPALTSPRGGSGKLYGQSVRSKRDLSSFKSSPNKKPSSVQPESSSPKKPTFKRRSKRDERPAPPKEEPKEEPADMWSSFLKDLSDAEEKFFSPSHAQSSSLLADGDSVGAASENILPAP
jgi:hypothetical protein